MNILMMLKAQRLEIFYVRLAMESPAHSHDEARSLLERVLNAVEDEFSGVPYDPESKDRMYPPRDDYQSVVAGRPSMMRYRSKGNYTWIDSNGAILITDLEAKTQFEKAGADGKTVSLTGP